MTITSRSGCRSAKLHSVLLLSTSLALTACGDGGSSGDDNLDPYCEGVFSSQLLDYPDELINAICSDVETDEDVEELTDNSAVLFPQMQGRWLRSCQLFDEEEPYLGYERSTLSITNNDFVVDSEVFSDSNCVIPMERGFLQSGSSTQSYGTLDKPVGSTDSPVGTIPLINFNFERFTIDEEPLISTAATFLRPHKDYTVVYVEGGKMYFGDFDVPGENGDSAGQRAVTLDFENSLTRQP